MRFTGYLFLLAASSVMATAGIQGQNEELTNYKGLSDEFEGTFYQECGNKRKFPKLHDRPDPVKPPVQIEGRARDPVDHVVYFSMSVNVPPPNDFVFYPSNQGNGQPNQFDPSSTNPSEPNYSSTFLVPADGTIANLNVRFDLTAINSVSPSFLFTVYAAESVIGSVTPIASWTATALSQSTGVFPVDSGTSYTGTFQNLGTSVAVTAGTILTVVITPSGYNRFDIEPATFSASFIYTPSSSR